MIANLVARGGVAREANHHGGAALDQAGQVNFVSTSWDCFPDNRGDFTE
jgi:hypothetical protein